MTHAEILALPADRALDALVAEKVMGWERGGLGGDNPDYWWCNPGYLSDTPHSLRVARTPRFSNDIAAAWQVVEKLRERRWLLRLYDQGDQYDVYLIHPGEKPQACATAGTMPLALCRAALIAHPEP